ncbi:MAG: hypothetical protein HOC93_06655 [Phycisphaerae bacterium]|jgi:hypothetical protein|nr:hypothetical protein [Phycisphaerae bacterium]
MQVKEASDITFLMIGCQRCGTTWTDAALREHPEVFLPIKKQSYFFDRKYDKGIEWYLSKFSAASDDHLAVGEIATGYCLPQAIPLMAKHLPHVKLLMVMRNPIERAYSNFQSRQAESNWSTFEEAIASDPDLLERGQYIDQIDELLTYYDRDQVLFLLYDDLHTNDQEYLNTVLRFIGVHEKFQSSLIGQRKNASLFPHLRKRLHQLGFKSLLSTISKSWIGDKVRRHRKKKGRSYHSMNQDTKTKLGEHFQPFNKKLSEFLQRDLSHWDTI